MIGAIYKTTNNINGKIYIGQTVTTGYELKHYFGSGNLIKRAIKKYGKENFTKEILKDNIGCQTALDLYEQIYIKQYNSQDITIGYNICAGGYGVKGYRHTEETKIIIGNASRGHITSEKQRAQISAALKGKPKSKEHVLKIIAANKGIKRTEEFKLNLSKRQTGTRRSNKSKETMKQSWIARRIIKSNPLIAEFFNIYTK